MIECISKCGVYRVKIYENKTVYTKNGNFHRDGDLPAFEIHNYSKEYWKNGRLHREDDLPAVETAQSI